MKIINFILFTIIYFSASIVLMGNQYRPLAPGLIYVRYACIILCFTILILVYFRKKGLTITRFPSFFAFYIFIIWVLFSFSVILSEILHDSFPTQGMFFLLVVPFIYYTVMPYVTNLSGPVIHYSLFAANFIYILISFITVPVQFLPYYGIVANPNGFGQIGAITVIAGIFLLFTLPSRRKLTKVLVCASVVLSLVGVILSSSRTSILVIGMVTLIFATYSIVIQKNMKPLLIIIFAGIISWFSPIKELFITGMVDKFSTFYNEGDLLNGRLGIWEIVFNDSALFGNGEDYFQNFFEGAHNSIVYILGVYGIVPALLLTIFLLLLIVIGFLNILKNKNDKFAIFPFVIIVTFFLFSMTEAMFGLIGNGITIAFYHVVGILLFKAKLKKEAINSSPI
jgi:O-antigen ligase